MRLEIDPGWEDNVLAATDALFEDKLGPAIVDDAKRYAPVRTGAMRDQTSHEVDSHTLYVYTTARSPQGAPYPAYVELGHRIAHGPHMSEAGPKVKAPQPWLRAALYQERGE